MFYLRCCFSDAFLSDDPDPDRSIVHDYGYHLTHTAKEANKALKAFGETRKKAMDFVVGGTQFLRNKTERISFSLKSYMNGEGEMEENGSRSTLLETSSTTSATNSQKPKFRLEVKPIPLIEEPSSSEASTIVYEVRGNIDDDSSDNATDDVKSASSI